MDTAACSPRRGEALTGAPGRRTGRARPATRPCASERAKRAPSTRWVVRRAAAKRSLVLWDGERAEPVLRLGRAPVSDQVEALVSPTPPVMAPVGASAGRDRG